MSDPIDPPDHAPGPESPERPASVATRRASWGRWELLALAELWALCGFAIAQPVLDVTGRSPEFFLFHGAGPNEIVLLALIVIVAPPAALWLLGMVTRMVGDRARRAVHVVTLAGLTTLLAIEAGKWLLPLRGVGLALLAALAGVAIAAAYVRWATTGRIMRLAGIGPPVFLLLFVFASPTSTVVLGGWSAGAAPGHATGPHPPVVVLVLDELPQVSLLGDDGEIDAERFPNFARLAAGSTWYRNATAVSGVTLNAVPTMLTGRAPRGSAPAHYSAHPNNLFTLLAGTYRMKVQDGAVQLCPPEVCDAQRPPAGGLPALLGKSASLVSTLVSPREDHTDVTAGFAEPTIGDRAAPAPRPKRIKPRWAPMRANEPVRFRAFVDGLRPAPEPTLHYLHLLLPHKPWRYLPSGVSYTAPETLPLYGGWWPRLAYERHIMQTQYVDTLLGLVLNAMRDSGLYDDALLVVTADHGIAFSPGTDGREIDRRQVGAPEIAWVPLFIKEPRQAAGRVDNRNWLHVDLLPTIADYAGVAMPWRVDGVSALRETRRTTDKPFRQRPGAPLLTLDGARFGKVVIGGPDDAVRLPEQPLPELIGRRVADLAVSDDPRRASVGNLDEFRSRDRAAGTVPAMVWGDLPSSAPAGQTVAIAVNGTIGAVVPVLPEERQTPRFAGLVTDESLFRAGANRLEIFLVDDTQWLHRLRLRQG
jgi:hypothetical protein